MAVKMSVNTSSFMEALFQEGDVALDDYAKLAQAGAVAEIGFYSVAFSYQSHHLSTNLPISSSTLLKKSGSEAGTQTCRNLVHQLIQQCWATWFGGVQPKPLNKGFSTSKGKVGPDSTVSDETVQSIAEALGVPAEDNSVAVPAPAPKAKKSGVSGISDIAKLYDAQFLGQKTFGTSPGSVYRCLAISSRLNVSARINFPAEVSIRAEGNPNAFEVGKLKSLGFTLSKPGGHWSLHLDTSGLTPARVIGAVLMDLGIQFDKQIMNLKEAQLEG